VQALDLEIHPAREAEQLVIETGVDARAQHRITEIARRDRFKIAVALLADRMRGLLEEEELELGGGGHGETHVLGLVEHAPQHTARTDRLGVAFELRHEEGQVVLERDEPHGLRQEADGGVGVGGVPSGQGGVGRRADRSSPSREPRHRN
jgi:hypothetical protein